MNHLAFEGPTEPRLFSTHTTRLPLHADAVIVGAGLMGCATAYYLAKAGLKPLVIDASRVAGQQSMRAWGFVRQQARDPAELPLAQASVALWEGLEVELQAPLQWRQFGCAFLAHNQRDMQIFDDWLPIAKEYGVNTRILSANETRGLLPGIAVPFEGACYTRNDGQAEPRLVTPAFARRATELGADFAEGCALTGIECKAGTINGVQTELGAVRTSVLILTAGSASWRILRQLGVSLPQHVVRGTVARTTAAPPISGISFIGNGIGFRQRCDGSFNLADDAQVDVDLTLGHLRGLQWFLSPLLTHHASFRFNLNGALLDDLVERLPYSESRELSGFLGQRDPFIKPNRNRVRASLDALHATFPQTRGVRVIEQWAGAIDVLPDGIPVIDAPLSHPGLLVATGFCGHGFALGPAVGKTLAAWVTTGAPGIDLHRLRMSRFAEGDVRPPYSLF